MKDEIRRSLAEATPGPWEIADTTDGYVLLDADGRELAFCESIGRADDARFIAEARTGWPEAIRRAMDAEKRLMAAEAEVGRLSTGIKELIEHFREMAEMNDQDARDFWRDGDMAAYHRGQAEIFQECEDSLRWLIVDDKTEN